MSGSSSAIGVGSPFQSGKAQAFCFRNSLLAHSVPNSPVIIAGRKSGGLLVSINIGQSLNNRNPTAILKATTGGISPASNDDDGVSLGTMKLPPDTDLVRFETLLFQWANSLCQGANLPMPMPLKVDKITGGARIGFIEIGDGDTEVLVYIDCMVFSSSDSSGPIFRAIRNGPKKAEAPPGEPRVMRSLLGALKKSVQIARV